MAPMDSDLQERIGSLVNEGYKFLGKDYSKPLGDKDVQRLEENGMRDCVPAIKIDYTRRMARWNGKELKPDAKYPDVIMALMGNGFTREQLIGTAASYFGSVCYLVSEEERQTMMFGLIHEAHKGLPLHPFAKEVMEVIMEEPEPKKDGLIDKVRHLIRK